MTLKEELQPLFNTGVYKGKTVAEIERLAGTGQGTIWLAIRNNSMSTRTLTKIAAVVGRKPHLVFKKLIKGSES
tara:strand:- start:7100 stop:7321 length:222 start_codon:yes stop_codon:yes gene_type:complete